MQNNFIFSWLKRTGFSILLLLAGFAAQAQEQTHEATAINSKMNVVFWVILIIFAGIALTLFILERRLNKLEKQKK